MRLVLAPLTTLAAHTVLVMPVAFVTPCGGFFQLEFPFVSLDVQD